MLILKASTNHQYVDASVAKPCIAANWHKHVLSCLSRSSLIAALLSPRMHDRLLLIGHLYFIPNECPDHSSAAEQPWRSAFTG